MIIYALFRCYSFHVVRIVLSLKAPNTTKAEFADTVDPDDMAHNEQSHLDLQCLPSSPLIFNIIHFKLEVLGNFAGIILSPA